MRSLLTHGLIEFLNDLGLTEYQKARFMEFAISVRLADDRVAFAIHLLAMQAPRPEIRNRLMVRHGLSRRQAYRVISEALEIRNNRAAQMAQLAQNIDAMKKNFAPDAASTNNYEAGQNLISAMQSKVDSNKENISALYKKLSDANGGSLPLDGQSFAIEANKALGGLTGKAEFLPPPVQSILNRLQDSTGQMDYSNFEALRSILATEARSNTNGNAIAAVNTVRNVLENMPMTAETEGIKPLADAARSAAKEHFDLMRDVPAYKAVANGTAEPDNFAKKFILGAPTSHVNGMANVISDNPDALQEMKAVGMHYLKDSAINHAGIFSQNGYNNALDKLSPKLQTLYGPDEAAQLKALGNVATHVQTRPAGSYVNTSNTETANLARGAGDMAAHAINAATNSPAGSIINNAVQSAVENKAKMIKLNSMLQPGAGISSPNVTTNFLKNTLPNASGRLGTVSLSSILGNLEANDTYRKSSETK